MFWLNRLTPQTGADDLFWPLILWAAGTVCMFLPLSLASLGAVPKAEVAAASGLYNLTRQLGGSLAIAPRGAAPPPAHGAARRRLRGRRGRR